MDFTDSTKYRPDPPSLEALKMNAIAEAKIYGCRCVAIPEVMHRRVGPDRIRLRHELDCLLCFEQAAS